MCTSGDEVEYSPLGCAFSKYDPSLAQGMHSAFMALIYAQMKLTLKLTVPRRTPSDTAVGHSLRPATFWVMFHKACLLVLALMHITDRASSCPEDDQTPCNFLNRYTTPNPNIPAGGLVHGAGLDGDNFKDQRPGSNQTWVSHAYNAGLTGVFAGLNQMALGSSGYDQCL